MIRKTKKGTITKILKKDYEKVLKKGGIIPLFTVSSDQIYALIGESLKRICDQLSIEYIMFPRKEWVKVVIMEEQYEMVRKWVVK